MGIKYCKLTVILLITMVFSLGCAGTQPCEKIAIPELPPPVKPIKPVNVALVLSSGGFRGSAHIGVLEVLEEHNIKVDLIVGCSAGSFIGAFYADEPNAKAIKSKLMKANFATLVDSSWISACKAAFCPTGPVSGKAMQNFMLNNMRARDFAELKIPLIVVTTSLVNNQMETLQSGPIIPAVHASSALPPYFAPVNIYQDQLVDGGLIAPVPVSVAKEYNPKIIIAVDITKRPSLVAPQNAFDIAARAIDISRLELAQRQSSAADFVIRPDIIGYGTFDDEYTMEYYEAGRAAALQKIDAIKQAFLKISH